MQLRDEVDGLLEALARARRVVRHDREPERDPLPRVLPADLRDGDVEPVADALRDGADHAALLLERLRAVDVKLHAGGADDHLALARRRRRARAAPAAPGSRTPRARRRP